MASKPEGKAGDGGAAEPLKGDDTQLETQVDAFIIRQRELKRFSLLVTGGDHAQGDGKCFSDRGQCTQCLLHLLRTSSSRKCRSKSS